MWNGVPARASRSVADVSSLGATPTLSPGSPTPKPLGSEAWPAWRVSVTSTVATAEPERGVTRAASPSAKPRAAASATDTRRAPAGSFFRQPGSR